MHIKNKLFMLASFIIEYSSYSGDNLNNYEMKFICSSLDQYFSLNE